MKKSLQSKLTAALFAAAISTSGGTLSPQLANAFGSDTDITTVPETTYGPPGWMTTTEDTEETTTEFMREGTVVTYEETTDLRDLKAVRKLATAYAKLLFPHVRKLDDLADEDVDQFRQLYRQYCLEPAVRRRAIIREQCHYIDPEFHKEMPEFIMKQTLE